MRDSGCGCAPIVGRKASAPLWGLVERSLPSGAVEDSFEPYNTRMEPSRLTITCDHVAETRLIRSVGRHGESDE